MTKTIKETIVEMAVAVQKVAAARDAVDAARTDARDAVDAARTDARDAVDAAELVLIQACASKDKLLDALKSHTG